MSASELVRDVLSQLLDVDEQQLEPELALAAIEDWDSVNALRVLMFLEREVGAPLDFEAYSASQTLGDLIAVIDQLPSATYGPSA